MAFQKKKIQFETLNEYLREVRKKLKLSLKDVSERTAISQKFLEALESGKFNWLPSDVYVYGFLKKLARLYVLDENLLINQFKKERGILEQVNVGYQDTSPLNQKSFFKKIIITPSSLSISLGALFVAVTVIYIIWQVTSLNRTPTLEIFEPQNQQIIKESFVNVAGKTDPGIRVTINDQPIYVDSNGNFNTQIGLSGGPKELVFLAKNKFDKSVTKTLTVISNVTLEERAKLVLKIEALSDLELELQADTKPLEKLNLALGATKTLEANTKILLSTSDAGATRVTLNNRDLGLLGRSGEKLINIPFFAESDKIER